MYLTYCYLCLLFSLTFGIIFVFILKCQLKDPAVVFFTGNVFVRNPDRLNLYVTLVYAITHNIEFIPAGQRLTDNYIVFRSQRGPKVHQHQHT